MSDLAEKKAHVRAAKNTRDHDCHATGCEVQCKPAYFMCPKHWRMVPRRLQLLVWKHYSLGQEDGAARVTSEYLAVTDEAIRAVAAKEFAKEAT